MIPMDTLRWSALDDDTAPAWMELTNALATADDTGEHYEHVEDLVEELHEAGVDPARDTWAVWDGERMVAYAQLRVALDPDHDGRIRCSFGGGVLPAYRRQGIGRRLADLGEARALELADERHPGIPRFLRVDGGQDGDDVRRLWEARDYDIVRFFHEMGRPLPGPALEVPDVPGVRLVSPGAEHEEATRLAHNAAFRDHWGSVESPPEIWHGHWTARSYRADVSTLALGQDDEVLAYVMVGQWLEHEAYVNLVGTVPSARGRGLALAALARTVGLCADSGDFTVIELHVDSSSPTGATRLYERAGFAVQKTTAAYQRDLPMH